MPHSSALVAENNRPDDPRVDPHLGTVVHVVAQRQGRPNLPHTDCPFCPGGLEAPESYTTRWFKNRWPSLPDGSCEVILYSPEHEATLATLAPSHIRAIIDLWAQRTDALRQLDTGEYVMIFENRGAEIGATIPHPHGQIYAFDHVPERPARALTAQWSPDENPGERLVIETPTWRVWTEYAPVFPVSLRIAPITRCADMPSLTTMQRDHLAHVLSEVFGALDSLYDAPIPYMMWINQSPRNADNWPPAWMNIEIVSTWRGQNLPRYIAAAEVGSGEFFNPVDPADVAQRLRALITR